MTTKVPPCVFCGIPATRYCDFIIAQANAKEMHTCDLAFCQHCGRRIGHICVRGRRKNSGCYEIDYCALHQDDSPGRRGLFEAPSPDRLAEMRSELSNRALKVRLGS